MTPDSFSLLSLNPNFIFHVFAEISWIFFLILPIVCFVLLRDAWLYHKQTGFIHNIEWSLLEIKIPREVTRGPKSMEQFFYNLYSLRNAPGGFKEKYLDGEVTRWYSLEITGQNQVTRFFMRVPTKLKTTVVSMLYGAYNEIEVVDAEDYIDTLPATYDELSRAGFELFGTSVYLRKDSAYPLRTYEEFEDKLSEERTIDPISVVLEIVGNLKPEESLWMQILISPSGDGWQKKGHKIIEDLKKKGQAEAVPGMPFPRFSMRSPGEEKTMKDIEEKVSKAGYDSIIRYVYIAPKAMYNKELPERGIYAAFNQMASGDNGFKKNNQVATKTAWFNFPFILPKIRMHHRRSKMLEEYRERYIDHETFFGKLDHSTFFRLNYHYVKSVFSTAELATMFHPPTNVVMTSITMDRIESKRLSPPANLPG